MEGVRRQRGEALHADSRRSEGADVLGKKPAAAGTRYRSALALGGVAEQSRSAGACTALVAGGWQGMRVGS